MTGIGMGPMAGGTPPTRDAWPAMGARSCDASQKKGRRKLSGNEIFFNCDETESKEAKNKKNGSKNRAERTIQVIACGSKATCTGNGSKRGSCFMLGSQ